jgi:hypothetical protein
MEQVMELLESNQEELMRMEANQEQMRSEMMVIMDAHYEKMKAFFKEWLGTMEVKKECSRGDGGRGEVPGSP